MILTPKREVVIQNIQAAANEGRLNDKVEVDDAVYTDQQRRDVLEKYMKARHTFLFHLKNWLAGRILDVITWVINRHTTIIGIDNIRQIRGSCIITSNHFNPDENTAIRLLSQKMKKGNLYIVSQDTNLAMKGMFGFFAKYVDIIPISPDYRYMATEFDRLIDEAVKRRQNILIYPEMEMWYNYRKPRPCKRGAYYYAAKHHLPVLPCFVEIREFPKKRGQSFYDTRLILHVLKPIYADPNKSIRENSISMSRIDYEQKKEAYEKAYGKPLNYEFEPWDIAGWRQNEE